MKIPGEIVRASIEAAPAAVAITAGPLFGVTLTDLAAILGCIFLIVQLAYLIWKWRRDYKREKAFYASLDD